MQRAIIPTPTHAVGDVVHGFTISAVTPIDDVKGLVYEARHEKTGAQVVQVACHDEENMFSVGFRTPPHNACGTAHIIEHSVLSGSAKYPVKEAFNELRKRSLNTFLNAMTWPERTVYPVTSAVRADYFHLASVYFDLVFHPLLTRETFAQEGHHLELANLDDLDSELIVSGVVYNEMKGANSAPERAAFRAIAEELLYDTAYRFDSGGDPDHIPDLTYEAFLAFHTRYYSPTNARFFFYGDIALADQLAFLGPQLDAMQRVEVDTHIEPQTPWAAPRAVHQYYPVGPSDEVTSKTFVVVNFLTNDSIDVAQTVLMDVAMEALTGSSGAPMRKALVKSGLGEAPFPGGGYGSMGPHTHASFGLRGANIESADAIEALVLDTARRVADEGLPEELIEAAFHQIELAGKSISRPFALPLLMRANTFWYFGGDPKDGLRFSEQVEAARARWAEDPEVFQKLVRRWVVDNPHRLRIVLEPSITLQAERDAAFAERMASRKAALTVDALTAIVDEAKALKAAQETPDSPAALATLPTLTAEEIPHTLHVVETSKRETNAVGVLEHPVFSNGIGYVGLAFDTRDLEEDDALLLPFMGRVTRGMGAGGLTYDALDARIALRTGGVALSPFGGRHVITGDRAERLSLSSSALARNIEPLFAILADLLLTPDCTDHERIKELLSQSSSHKAAQVAQSGHAFARLRAAATLDPTMWREEQWGGLTSVRFLKQHARNPEQGVPLLAERIAGLQKRLFTRERLILSLVGDEEVIAAMRAAADQLIAVLPEGERVVPHEPTPPALGRDVGVAIPSTVNFVCRTLQLPNIAHPIAPALSLLSNVLRGEFLYPKIRLQGGAYGAFSLYNLASGILTLLSYRDPHLSRTFSVFDEVAAFVGSDAFDDALVNGSRIGAIGAFDSLLSPGQHLSVGRSRALLGPNDALRRGFREGLFEVDAKLIKTQALPLLEAALANAPRVVFGARKALESANEAMALPLPLEEAGI